MEALLKALEFQYKALGVAIHNKWAGTNIVHIQMQIGKINDKIVANSDKTPKKNKWEKMAWMVKGETKPFAWDRTGLLQVSGSNKKEFDNDIEVKVTIQEV